MVHVSRQINAVMSVYSLSPEGHHNTGENLLRPNQYADLSVIILIRAQRMREWCTFGRT